MDRAQTQTPHGPAHPAQDPTQAPEEEQAACHVPWEEGLTPEGSRTDLEGHSVAAASSAVQGSHSVLGAEVQVRPAVPQSLDDLSGVVQLSSKGQRGL